MSKPTYVQDSEPATPLAWQDWVKPSSGEYFVRLPEGRWGVIGNLKQDRMGFLSSNGGVVNAPITGPSGHAPEKNADILESLRLNGVDVATIVDMDRWEQRIVAELTAALNLQKTTDGTTASQTLLGMVVWDQGSIAVRHEKQFNFSDPTTPLGDIRPSFPDGTKPDWGNCLLNVWIEGLATPKDGAGLATGDAFIPAGFDANWNMTYPTGIWFRWVSRNPPIVKVNAFEMSAKGNTALALGYSIIGRR